MDQGCGVKVLVLKDLLLWPLGQGLSRRSRFDEICKIVASVHLLYF
jgi:hypothetical protein